MLKVTVILLSLLIILWLFINVVYTIIRAINGEDDKVVIYLRFTTSIMKSMNGMIFACLLLFSLRKFKAITRQSQQMNIILKRKLRVMRIFDILILFNILVSLISFTSYAILQAKKPVREDFNEQ